MLKRFAVVMHDWRKPGKRVDVHNLWHGYNWVSLSNGYVLLVGNIHPTRVMTVERHPKVLLLPSLFSSKTIFEHAEEQRKSSFCIPLRECLALQPQHQMLHLAEIAHQLHGRIFALDV
jgi:hypothetical protein